MKIVIIGAVAAGTSAAAKARRNDEKAEIKIYEMDRDISYSGCGLPYYIGGRIPDRGQIVPRNAAYFKKKYNVDIFTRHKVLEIFPAEKKLTVMDLESGEEFTDTYDKLVIATGAKTVLPGIDGSDKPNVFTLRNVENADGIKSHIAGRAPRRAVIIGSGYIGMEMLENLHESGIKTTVIEAGDHVMASLDRDIAVYLESMLEKKGVEVILKDSAVRFEGEPYVERVVLGSGRIIETDLVIVSVGVRPEVSLAAKAGVHIGPTGAISINRSMQTNFPDIYAAGDCAESFSLITGKPLYRPLGSTANKTGRIAGDSMTGGDLEFRGILGTSIFKIFETTVAQTGLSEAEARAEGYDVETAHLIKPDRPEYFGGRDMVIKAVAEKACGRLLGAQIIGEAGVDKRIDVFATAISFGARVGDLFHLDLAYAPPYATSKDPAAYTGMVLENAINRGRKLITADELESRLDGDEKITVLDARPPKQFEASHIEGALNIPQENMREELCGLDKDGTFVTYCNRGVTGNAAQNILLNNGFREVYNLSGGHKNYAKRRGR